MKLHLLAIYFAVLGSAVAGSPTLLTFDDLPEASSGQVVPNGYAGLNWNTFGYLDVPLHYGTQQNGYQAGMISANNVAYNRGGNPATISSPGSFDLLSGYLTAAWYDNLQVEALGYVGGTLTYSNLYSPSATVPTLINFNYLGVTKVEFTSSGGTVHPGYNNGGEMFVLDNVTVNVPEPSALALLGVLGAARLIFRCRH